MTLIRWFDEVGNDDVEEVGGKNASLGEMISALREEGIRVPDGFATTANAYRLYLDDNDLTDELRELLGSFDDGADLAEVGSAIRKRIEEAEMPSGLRTALVAAYRELGRRAGTEELDVAVRSSATAEDLPDASFAGQQATYLNVRGEDELVDATKRCFASLFTDRAISYREEHGFDHLDVALSVGIQRMVRSDHAGAGVMFTIDPESGFPDAIVVDAAWGLGETVVGGQVNPDRYTIFKPLLGQDGIAPIVEKHLGAKRRKEVYASGGETETEETSEDERRAFVLTDEEVLTLAVWGCAIERHYGCPMDVEWAKDGDSGDLFIVQARPETVQSRKGEGALRTYRLQQGGDRLVDGLAIGEAIATGPVCRIDDTADLDRFTEDGILVTGMTDPDWLPAMRRAAAVVTDLGGRTSHAAIVSRELGIPAIVGAEDATDTLEDGRMVTVSCAEGATAYVYDGELDFEAEDVDLTTLPETRTRIMMNIASPDAAYRWWRLPTHGVGLARMEFVINNVIKIHPLALTRSDTLEDEAVRERIEKMTAAYATKEEYFVDRLARGIAKIASAQHPHPAIVRMSDFKTNEYADLIGGEAFEPVEANPMLGFRGASRYTSERYRDGFALECAAVRRVREEIGLRNVVVMIPFCRTPEEADRVLEVMAEEGLVRGKDGLEVYVMGELPSNVLLAEEFCERFDGFSIGSNDLTQLVLGVDRDSAELQHLFDERHPAVERAIERIVTVAHEHGCKVGLCGQAPSDHPEFAALLVRMGIDSMSLNPDSVVRVIREVAEAER